MDSLAMKMDPDNAVGDVGDIEATLNYIRSRKRGLFGQIHQGERNIIQYIVSFFNVSRLC
jgi:hypothetical protein